VVNTIDPLGGSYAVEALTQRIEEQVYSYFDRIEALGGVLPAIETGFLQQEVADAAYRYQREIDERKRIVVGVNEYEGADLPRIPILRMDPAGYSRQCARLERVRAERDSGAVGQALDRLRIAAQGTENTMPYLLEAVRAYATLQEIMDVFRDVYGLYREPMVI
jgi:methylmalonyl-CoA mutase N-terminal domain/subunit